MQFKFSIKKNNKTKQRKKCILVVLKKNILRSANVLCALVVFLFVCLWCCFVLCFFFEWVEVGRGAWPCTTCQSRCLGNVENTIDSFLVVTAAGFSHPQAAEIRRRETGFALFLSFCLSRRPWSMSHFSLHVVLSRLQKHLESFYFFVFLLIWVVSFFLIVRRDVYFLGTRLFCREPPPVHVMRAFLFLLRVRAFLLQFLSLKFRSSVLKPNFDLSESRRGWGEWGRKNNKWQKHALKKES